MNARLVSLRARPRRSGAASFFWIESGSGRPAVKVLPGEHYVDDGEVLIVTTLGSCIATCLWDREAHIGGLNHFLLPEGDDAAGQGGRYGAYAMELLINELLKRGAARAMLEAKVFGGGQVVAGMDRLDIGERNVRFVLDYLRTERIPITGSDLRGRHPRRVSFDASSGQAMVRRLPPAQAFELAADERRLAHDAATRAGACAVELF